MQPQNPQAANHNQASHSLVQSSPNLFESSLTSPSVAATSTSAAAPPTGGDKIVCDVINDRLTSQQPSRKDSVTSHWSSGLEWSKEEKEELIDIWASFGLFEGAAGGENGVSFYASLRFDDLVFVLYF